MKTQGKGKKELQLNLTCSNCGTDLEVDSLLIAQFQRSIEDDLHGEIKRREEELLEQQRAVREQSDSLEREKEDLNTLINEKVKSQLLTREQVLRQSIVKEIESEKELQLNSLNEELQRKSAQLKDLNQTKAKMQRLTMEFEEKEAEIILKKEQEMQERIHEMKSSVQAQVQLENDLKLKEKQSLIESLERKLTEASNQIGHGSRLAGEAQELILEEILREANPYDLIEEIAKGVLGADCIQKIKTQFGVSAGTILYESKRTKTWSSDFIPKLKQDGLKFKADILVIVTRTLPKEANGKFCLIDGAWITTLENVRDLSLMLRYGLLKTFAVMQTQENKQDKKEMLYSYLCSEEFKQVFSSILDGFNKLNESHVAEQQKLQLLWKKREKYLQQVLSSTIDFYGSIKGISDNVPEMKMLEINQAG